MAPTRNIVVPSSIVLELENDGGPKTLGLDINGSPQIWISGPAYFDGAQSRPIDLGHKVDDSTSCAPSGEAGSIRPLDPMRLEICPTSEF